jgi:prepilin-type N-terminal cleavage/methylation domain-containing protein
MISNSRFTGQLKFITNQRGFSMIETLIVAAILAALSLFAMELLDRQSRMLKSVEHKFAMQSVHAQISHILSSSVNCRSSLETLDIKDILLSDSIDSQESAIESLQKEFTLKVDDEIETEIRPTYSINKGTNDPRYEGISIQKYTLSLREDNFLDEDSLTATISLNVHYDLGANTLGGRYHRRSINLALKFNPDEPATLSSCYGGNSSASASSLTIIDPLEQADLSGISGTQACQNLGKVCVQVISLNYASKAFGQIGIGNLCQINYNQPLEGVKQGSPISNIHSCEALLGQYETYKIEQTGFGVTCQGIFKAQCQ